MADVHSSQGLIPYAPRNVLKTLLAPEITTQLRFSFVFEKHPSKDEKEQPNKLASSNRGMLTYE